MTVRLPLRHLSIRVPWHDNGWTGSVCRDPTGNAACLVLQEIRETRDDDFEAANAGRSIEELDQTKRQWPACMGERGSFMASFEHTRLVAHPYASFSDEHRHIQPAAFRHPPYSAATIPFRWMARETAWELAQEWDLDVDQDREPTEGFLGRTVWVQDHDNQRALLDAFFSAAHPERSLCFFYAKQTPMVDDEDRILIGAGRVIGTGESIEYNYTAPGYRSYVWDRAVLHSVRPSFDDGFLLPYAELLEAVALDDTIDLRACTAVAPADRRIEFSYAGEHVTHDGAIAALLNCREALENAKKHLAAPVGGSLAWIDARLGDLWSLRGPTPGLGAVLGAFGVTQANLLAYQLQDRLGENEDPWPLLDQLMEDPSSLGERADLYLTRTTRDKWRAVRDKRPERRALIELLGRFELTTEQATRFLIPEERERAGIECTDEQLLRNPYLLYELDRAAQEPVSVLTADRGTFPNQRVRAKHPLPELSRLDDPTDRRRVRALAVAALEDAAVDGHTLQPRGEVIRSIRDMKADPPCSVDGDLMELVEDSFDQAIAVVEMADGAPAYQLGRLDAVTKLIRDAIERRVKGIRHEITADWADLLNAELEDRGLVGVSDEERDREFDARAEKTAVLAELAAARFAVLIGPAGTGKTTLLKLLVEHPGVDAGGVLLLAPTGKARVQLEKSTGKRAQTLAQFLLPTGRYAEKTGAYRVLGKNKVEGAKTVIVDEASMLTEEMLGSLIDSLKGVDRLILVGDPRQLPPIGAGRPFYDIVDRLKPSIPGAKIAPGYTELQIRRRHIGERRADLELADWFSGAELGAGDDEIFARLGSEQFVRPGKELDDPGPLRFIQWEGNEDIREKVVRALAEEIEYITDVDDVKGFELSVGGSEYEGLIYFHRRQTAAAAEAWQILSPVRGLTHGVRELNRLIQRTFRADTITSARREDWGRRIPKPMGPEQIVYGDKVMNLVNHRTDRHYPKDDGALGYVANGEIGVVVGQFKGKNSKLKGMPWKLQVEFSSQPDYSYDFTPGQVQEERPMLELAYAVTVHKSQGSEFGTVFLVLPAASRLLSRELLYTALTRQRDRIVILHQGDRSELKRYASDYYSETKRRLTNLFVAPSVTQVQDRFLEERLIHRSSNGEPMRSKSEVIIADLLAAHGISYEYETALTLDGLTRWPDFTIEDSDSGRIFYWEHCGMLTDPDYRRRWERKLDWYTQNKILPVEQSSAHAPRVLVVTEDDEKGGISSQAIKQTIETLFA